MNKYKIISFNLILSALLKIFIIINLFFPYVERINPKNVTFILSNTIALLIIILLLFKKRSQNNNNIFLTVYIIILIIYNILFARNNLLYSHYFIEQINKNISFILFFMLFYKRDNDFIKKYRIPEFLIQCIIGTVLLSCVFYLIGGDALRIENGGFSARANGMFSDRRLTWLYGHKSSYALMLLLFMTILLKFKKIFSRKKYFYLSLTLIILTIILTASATAVGLTLIILGMYNVSYNNFKKLTMKVVTIIPFVVIIFAFLASFIMIKISGSRDITTFGNRSYIFKAAKEYLAIYPNGIGKQFGEIWMNASVMQIENFHNIFLNEMLRFSVPVGILFAIIFVYIAAFCIARNGFFIGCVWVACFVIFCIDHSLRTEQLSFFIFLMTIISIYDYDSC